MIVRNGEHVLNYRWCESENFDDYYELLVGIKEPDFLICDGHSGLMKAARKLWKNIGIQRCLFHVGLNAKAKLGKRSPYPEVHILREHILKISAVNTIRKAKNWYKKFERLCDEFRPFLDEKSYAIDPDTGEVLKELRRHQKPYSMVNMIRRLHKKGQLFLHLEHDIPNTTNFIEGGINARVKELVRCHRGLNIEKRKRICEWYLLSRSAENLDDFIRRFSRDS
jgi:transposase-like protein